jgi:hypothetical protein
VVERTHALKRQQHRARGDSTPGNLPPTIHPATWSLALSMFILGMAAVPTLAQSQQAPPAASTEASRPEASEESISQNPASPPQPGSISGTVVDKDGAVIANTRVVLTQEGAITRESLSGSDGNFTFAGVPPGPFELSVSSPGFATQEMSGILQTGQGYVTPQIQLVVATTVDVEVTQTREEIAEEQMRVEEQQRVFGIVPNFYVSYIPDAAPLTTKQKFKLGWKSTADPVVFGFSGVVAGIEQADNAFSGYGQGAQGYGKRLGATYANVVSGTFIGSVILPSVFRQDPRYFYKGTGSRKSRFFYALANAVICKGDNGRWQPNYSNMLGSLAAGGLSNLYYPASNRSGVGLTFENALIGIGGTAFGAVFEEFFLHKVTSHAPNTPPAQN